MPSYHSLQGAQSCSRKAALVALWAGAVTFSTSAVADEVDQCMLQQQAAYEAPQQFTQYGEITCPSGDIVGFPPRIRRSDRKGSVSYTAPEGTIIQDRSLKSIVIENVSQNNGSYGSPSISSDARTVSVPIACAGKGPGVGRSWQHIRVSGVIVRQLPRLSKGLGNPVRPVCS